MSGERYTRPAWMEEVDDPRCQLGCCECGHCACGHEETGMVQPNCIDCDCTELRLSPDPEEVSNA